MSANVKVQLGFRQVAKAAGAIQTASVSVTVKDASGTPVSTTGIDAPNGTPAADSATLSVPAGSGYVAWAQSLASDGTPTGDAVSSPPFDVEDDVMVTVVASVAKE